MGKLLLVGENRKLVNNLDKAIYYFRKISDNENDIEKYVKKYRNFLTKYYF